MPTYDYECKACGHRFETFQGIKDATLKKCPKCGKLKLNRLIGAGAGFLFKGSGFYITDYRSSSYKEKAKSESKPAESSKAESKSAESSSKSESKPSSPDKSSGSCSSGTGGTSTGTGGSGKPPAKD